MSLLIASLKGQVVSVEGNHVILDVCGVGYEVLVSGNALLKVTENPTDARVVTHMQVREDGMTLFGFSDKEEKKVFEKMITVSGVGPKLALGILTQVSSSEFRQIIARQDKGSLVKITGVGKKTAERLILELRDVFCDAIEEEELLLSKGVMSIPNLRGDAVEALCALGYTQVEAEHMIKEALESLGEVSDLQQLLKTALANPLSKKGGSSWKRNA